MIDIENLGFFHVLIFILSDNDRICECVEKYTGIIIILLQSRKAW